MRVGSLVGGVPCVSVLWGKPNLLKNLAFKTTMFSTVLHLSYFEPEIVETTLVGSRFSDI